MNASGDFTDRSKFGGARKSRIHFFWHRKFEADRHCDRLARQRTPGLAEFKKSIRQENDTAIDLKLAMHDAQAVDGGHQCLLLGVEGRRVEGNRPHRRRNREIGGDRGGVRT